MQDLRAGFGTVTGGVVEMFILPQQVIKIHQVHLNLHHLN